MADLTQFNQKYAPLLDQELDPPLHKRIAREELEEILPSTDSMPIPTGDDHELQKLSSLETALQIIDTREASALVASFRNASKIRHYEHRLYALTRLKKIAVRKHALALAAKDAELYIRNMALAFFNKLYTTLPTHDQTELDALTQLRLEITTASASVQALLPGGSNLQLLAAIDARLTPLIAAIALSNRIASIEASHNRTELDALTQLRLEITTASASVQALLPGGSNLQLLAAIDARLTPLTAAIALSNRIASIEPSHDQIELEALTNLRAEISGASVEVRALLPGGSNIQLLATIDARIEVSSRVVLARENARQLLNEINAVEPENRNRIITTKSRELSVFDLTVADKYEHDILFYAGNYGCASEVIDTLRRKALAPAF